MGVGDGVGEGEGVGDGVGEEGAIARARPFCTRWLYKSAGVPGITILANPQIKHAQQNSKIINLEYLLNTTKLSRNVGAPLVGAPMKLSITKKGYLRITLFLSFSCLPFFNPLECKPPNS